MADFPNVDLNAFFNRVWAPGAAPFGQAMRFWQNQMKLNSPDRGLAQLAAARVSDPQAEAYANGPYLPDGAGLNAALGARAGLTSGAAKARTTAQSVSDKVNTTATGGALDAAQGFGQSLTDYIAGQIALNRAQGAASGGILGDITGGIGLLGGIGSEIVAPGNPMGIGMIASGAGNIAGSNLGFGGGGSVGSPMASMYELWKKYHGSNAAASPATIGSAGPYNLMSEPAAPTFSPYGDITSPGGYGSPFGGAMDSSKYSLLDPGSY